MKRGTVPSTRHSKENQQNGTLTIHGGRDKALTSRCRFLLSDGNHFISFPDPSLTQDDSTPGQMNSSQDLSSVTHPELWMSVIDPWHLPYSDLEIPGRMQASLQLIQEPLRPLAEVPILIVQACRPSLSRKTLLHGGVSPPGCHSQACCSSALPVDISSLLPGFQCYRSSGWGWPSLGSPGRKQDTCCSMLCFPKSSSWSPKLAALNKIWFLCPSAILPLALEGAPLVLAEGRIML